VVAAAAVVVMVAAAVVVGVVVVGAVVMMMVVGVIAVNGVRCGSGSAPCSLLSSLSVPFSLCATCADCGSGSAPCFAARAVAFCICAVLAVRGARAAVLVLRCMW
jgi:hypothetical protein